ncbi:MAG: hypothetical protein MNPFHGCM_01702 [Gemmatimonadaceae bacterium]|nr:hypothetical protein [Gemmatimonadaceae bacterium]
MALSLALPAVVGPEALAQTANAASRPWMLIVSGASGEARFAAEFTALGSAFRDAAVQRFGIPDSMAIWLAEDPTRDPTRIRGRSTRATIDTTLGRIAIAAGPTDRIFILLMGHGSSQAGISRFNVPGPDVTDADFRSYLERFPTQTVVFVNATSASGEFVKSLRGRNRIVLAATKSGAEGNETVFARHFVRAYTSDGADVDKDGRVSLLEAFSYAHREVQREYEQANKLLTEHAVLDDDGDGVGRGDPGPNGPDGPRARAFFLAPPSGVSAAVASDPRAAALLEKRERIEASIDSLRLRKASIPESTYQQSLEDLVVKLAEVNRALKALEGKKP